jgi:hypothetical protein
MGTAAGRDIHAEGLHDEAVAAVQKYVDLIDGYDTAVGDFRTIRVWYTPGRPRESR